MKIQQILILCALTFTVACNSTKDATSNTQVPVEVPKGPVSDQIYQVINGYQVPVIQADSLEAAIAEAKRIMGTKSHGYFMWKNQVYDFSGSKIDLNK